VKFGGAGGENERATVAYFDLDVRRACGRGLFGFLGRFDFVAAEEECCERDQKEGCEPDAKTEMHESP
jgi:hypothetical protein